MKALCIWFGLIVWVSGGEREVVAVSLFPNNDKGNQVIDAKSNRSKDTVNVFANAVDKNYATNEYLRNNGLQNNLVYHARRSFDNNNLNQEAENVDGFRLDMNSSGNDPSSRKSFESSYFFNLPHRSGLLNRGPQYWVNGNIQNSKLGYLFRPRPSTSFLTSPINLNHYHAHTNPYIGSSLSGAQSSVANIKKFNANLDLLDDEKNVKLNLDLPDNVFYHPSLHLPVDNIVYNPFKPDVNLNPPNVDTLNPWGQNDFECEKHADIINDIRILVRKQDISEESYSLKLLFRILELFINKNHLYNVPFHVAVKEIELALLKESHANLKTGIEEFVQKFQKTELQEFFYEIKSGHEKNLQLAVSKLAQLLYNFKNSLIQKGYYQRDIRLVITRLVQWSVPLVGYYFERECKVKTQKYILHNLEVALNVDFEDVKHVGSIQELEAQGNLGVGSILYPGGLDNLEDLGMNALNPGIGGNLEGLEIQGDLEGLGTEGNLVSDPILHALQKAGLDNLGNSGLGRTDVEYYRASEKRDETKDEDDLDTQAA